MYKIVYPYKAFREAGQLKRLVIAYLVFAIELAFIENLNGCIIERI
jgi:hypothetical protein